MNKFGLAAVAIVMSLLPSGIAAQGISPAGGSSDYMLNIDKAREGNPDSQRIVAECYHHGIGVKENINEAWKWYVRAAGNGDSEAQYVIGTLYRDGLGVRQNDQEAAYWFRKAASNGHALAQVNIARQFAEGRGVLQDYRVAAENYWRAAERGNDEGAYYYALMLRDGKGVSQDLPRALKYFRQAAANNYKDAEVLAQMLEQQGVKMTEKKAPTKKVSAQSDSKQPPKSNKKGVKAKSSGKNHTATGNKSHAKKSKKSKKR